MEAGLSRKRPLMEEEAEVLEGLGQATPPQGKRPRGRASRPGLPGSAPSSPAPSQGEEEGLQLAGEPVTGTPSGPLKHERTVVAVEEEYEVLESNVYPGSLQPGDLGTREEEGDEWCKCAQPAEGETGCGSLCDNRSRREECHREYCKARENCSNMAISSQTAAKVWLDQGRLVATEDLGPDRFLAQYTGEVITRLEMETRLKATYRPGQKLHVFPLGDEAVVDSTTRGSVARLAVHSCSPNTTVVTWMAEVEGQRQAVLAMYSLRDIKEGEQLSYDYSPQLEVLKVSRPCSCGSRACRKLLGATVTTTGPVQCSACQVALLEPGSPGEVFLHPGLALPVCSPCKEKVQAADWNLENTCRWCVQRGVDGITCSTCPAHFCRKCLNVNLGPGYIKLATASLGSWSCLLCHSAPLSQPRSKLRAPAPPPSLLPARVMTGRSPGGARPPPGHRPQVVRAVRPTTPRMVRPRNPGARALRPGTPALSRGRLPSPRLVGAGVSILAVPSSPSPPPKVQPVRNEQAARLISQLQRYGGLSIQPVSEQTGLVDTIVRELEGARKIIAEAIEEVQRGIKAGDSLGKTKDKVAESMRAARAKLANVEAKI